VVPSHQTYLQSLSPSDYDDGGANAHPHPPWWQELVVRISSFGVGCMIDLLVFVEALPLLLLRY